MQKRFVEDPELYLKYCKAIEAELNGMFKVYMNGTKEAAAAKEVSLADNGARLKYNSVTSSP